MTTLRGLFTDKRITHGLVLVICFSVIGSIAWSPIRVLSLQSQAGELIETYYQAHVGQYDNHFICQIPALRSLPTDESLQIAVESLENARRFRPQDAHTDVLLGRAYCLMGEFLLAAEAFEEFNRKRPNNPLGKLEAGFAYFLHAITTKNISETERQSHVNLSRQYLEAQGLSVANCREYGDVAFGKLNFSEAWFWYRLAGIFQPLSEISAFKTAYLDIAYGQNHPYDILPETHLILDKESPLLIEPSSFIRFSNDEPVKAQMVIGEMAGVYFTNADKGVLAFQVENQGQYCLSVKALDRPPEPTNIELTLNLERILLIKLPNGDDVWKDFDTELYMDEGLHVLGLRLTNDQYIEGEVDRNGHVGEIIIQACQD
jgi:tetratricopeptide (TPR) repeat protein